MLRRHFENGDKNVTVAEFQRAFARCRNSWETVGNLTVKNRFKTLMPRNCTYTLRIDHSRTKSVEKCSVFIILECSHGAVFEMCRLRVPLSKSTFFETTGKDCVVFVSIGGLSVTFFHRFQNVPALCERNLNYKVHALAATH